MADNTRLQTFDQLTEECIDRFGTRDDIDDRVADWLNSAQLWFARSDIEIPQLETFVSVDLIALQAEYNLVTDFKITDLIGIRLCRNQTKNWLMRRFPFVEYRKLSTQSQNSPIRFTRNGLLYVVDPIPVLVETIKIDYRREPVPSVLEVGPTWIEFLMRLTMHIGWLALQEYSIAQTMFASLPMWLQKQLITPLTEAEWEADADEDLGFAPSLRW